MTLRELLNDHLWHHEDLGQLTLVVRHRGAPGDVRHVEGVYISEIGATGLTVESALPGEEDTFLPYHRVLQVLGPAGVLYTSGPNSPRPRSGRGAGG
jgi:uncharacterized protein (UPF0248 family)